MDMMLLGEVISHKSGTTAVEYEGFWMPAAGNEGVAAVEVFLVSTASVYTVYLQTKSSDQADSAATSAGSKVVDSTTPGVFKFDVNNAKDLVRYTVKVTGAEPSDEYMHFQFCQPLWAPN